MGTACSAAPHPREAALDSVSVESFDPRIQAAIKQNAAAAASSAKAEERRGAEPTSGPPGKPSGSAAANARPPPADDDSPRKKGAGGRRASRKRLLNSLHLSRNDFVRTKNQTKWSETTSRLAFGFICERK